MHGFSNPVVATSDTHIVALYRNIVKIGRQTGYLCRRDATVTVVVDDEVVLSGSH